MEKHIFACDERGNTNIGSSSKSFVLGGFAGSEVCFPTLILKWNEIKKELCGDSDVELKWCHFFPGYHQKSKDNPLSSKDPKEWKAQALWAVDILFANSNVFPISTVIRKNKIGQSLITQTKKGKHVLDKNIIFITTTIPQFLVYMKKYNVEEAEIWFDRLGSENEEKDLQSAFISLMNDLIKSAHIREFLDLAEKINPEIKFLDSKASPIIQVADFLSGVIYAASEGDNWFLLQLKERYAPGANRTYGIVILEE